MVEPPSPPLLARALAVLALLAPLPSLIGWITATPWLVQPMATFAPARAWGTVMIPLGALAMVAKLRGHRREARAFAWASMGVALVGMIAAVVGVPLPLDGWAAARVGMPLHPETRAISLSIGALFLMGNSALLLLASSRPSDRKLVVAGALAATQLAMASVLFLSQLAGLLEPSRYPMLQAPLHGLLAAMALGGALLQRATAREYRTPAPPRWAPVLAGVSTTLVVLVLWQALTAREAAQARSRDAMAIAALDRAVQRQYGTVHRALGRTAVYLATSTQRRDPVWETTLPRLIDETDGLARLIWTDARGRLLRAVPDSAPDAAGLASLQRFVASGPVSAALDDTSAARHSIALDGPWRVALWSRVPSPVFDTTYLFAIIDEPQLLRLFADDARQAAAIRASDGAALLLAKGTLRADALSRTVQIGPRTVQVAMSGPAQESHSPLPDVVLALGLAVAALLAITLWLQRRIWEQAQADGMTRMQEAIERATDGIWELDVRTNATHRSAALLRSLAIDAALLARGFDRWLALIHPDDVPRVSDAIGRHLRGDADAVEVEYRVRAGDGTWHTLMDRGRVVERDGAGRPVRLLGISADVTERLRAEVAIEESERRFRVMFETAFQVQLLLDLDGTILEANEAAGELAGVAPDALPGRAFAMAPWWAHDPSIPQQIQARFERARAGETQRFEVELTEPRDRPTTVDFSLKPIRDAEERVVQVLAEGRDLTIRKRAEESLREISALTTMGQLAARVAHEINNPLAGIQNAFLLIRGAIPTDHPHYRFVGAIEREIGRIAAVTRQLYETYRPDALMERQASVTIAISDAVSFLEQVNRARHVRIVTDVSQAPSMVPVPDALLRQTLYNLVQNAVDVSPMHGTIEVRAWVQGDECVLTVADEGPGVPPAIRERIFDPFFSTKDRTMKTGGMGIGLTLVRQSVLAVGGRIEVRSRPQGGASLKSACR
ncbi:MAG: PAS domain S-box protein [Gemmatimonadaceae bacterium]|nr:PAS domain S-box protein [Gemmatimonadaceae bacterium]